MILRSSLIFNLTRFFLPLPLLGESFFLGDFLFNGLFGLGFSFAPRNYLKFTQLSPFSSLGVFYTQQKVQGTTSWLVNQSLSLGGSRNIFNSDLAKEKDIITNFVTVDFPEAYENFVKKSVPLVSPEMKDSLNRLELFCQKTVNNKEVSLYFSEIVALMLSLDNWPNATVLPARIAFPYSENAFAIAPFETSGKSLSSIL